MYSTCLFCNSDLGVNQAIERFPVGRRLAFDPAKGRLWVVCRKCERWNLSPIEERWEAIEECERLFRATRLRVSTDNVGLARVREGLELVRIGEPQRPEMAAWRYGDQFGRRRRRYYVLTGTAAAGILGVYFVGPALGLYAAGGFGFLGQMPQLVNAAYKRLYGRVRITLAGAARPLIVNFDHSAGAQLVPEDSEQGWALRVPFVTGSYAPPSPGQPWPVVEQYQGGFRKKKFAVFSGEEALRVAGKILPKINLKGAGKDDVQRAVGMLETQPDSRRLFAAQTLKRARVATQGERGRVLGSLPKPVRLALEMAAHEDTERRALEGELAMLEAAWKEAEEIAAISDNLFLPAEVEAWLTKLKRRRG